MQRIMLYHILNMSHTNLLHSIPTCELLNVTKYIYVGADVVILYLSMSTGCYFLLLQFQKKISYILPCSYLLYS